MTTEPERRTPLDFLHERAEREPRAVAVSDDTGQDTVAEARDRVLRIAAAASAALRDAPDDAYLPVLVDRSRESVVLLLACLLGRVRFFPVDATAPAALVERLIARAGAPGWHLAAPHLMVPVDGSRRVEIPVAPQGVADATVGAATDDAPAVVVFSSGSTGEPKGIVLSWSALERRWRSRAERAAQLGHAVRQPLVVPLDSSWALNQVMDIAAGTTLHVCDVARTTPTRFLASMAALEPTTMVLPSQLGRLLAQLPERQVVRLPSVRWLNVGSEGFRYEYLHGLGRIFDPETVVAHSLTSTEGGRVIATSFALGDAPESGRVRLGRITFPEDVRLVSVDGLAGGVSEVHVSGAIASGYLGDPTRTEDRFYRDPDGRRWWRSGDLVRADESGMLVHEGRADDVVKVGGKLASPSDVTAVLMALDGVRAAITVPVTTAGATRLVAHIELEVGARLTLDQVRVALADRLAPHAVPTAVMRHARLPVNARGKVDRGALMDGPFEPW